jgi:glucose/arabinose dehydrogenase/mono/diheme cytochrome c family protein
MLRSLFLFLILPSFLSAAPIPIFDGKTLDGWEGTAGVWRVENGAITGGSMEGNPKNEFLATKKDYRNFILTFEYKLTGTEGFVNGGVQFHSQRIDNPPNEMIGYQADIGGPKYSGSLYDESRRKVNLATADEKLVTSLEKPGEWNRYEIRAEGDRIRLSINGTETITYTEKDPKIPLSGKIALQIHGDCKAVISFRKLMLDALPDDITPDQGQIMERFGDPALAKKSPSPWTLGKFEPAKNEVIIFAGQTNLAREQKSGTLEAALATVHASKKPVFRSMAWEADTVYEQWRDLNFGSWESQLRAAGATAAILQFGQMEALDGVEKLPQFSAAYHRLLDQFTAVTPRLVLLSPTPFEKPLLPLAPDLSLRNKDLKAYTDVIREIAAQRGAIFVDLFTPFSTGQGRLTENGVHLTDQGLETVATTVSGQLGAIDHLVSPDLNNLIVEKNRLWFDCWRPANWSFVYGDRVQWPFGKTSADAPSLRSAFESLKPLIAARDAEIHATASGSSLPAPSPLPTPPVVETVPPLTPEEQMAKFTLADGYQINLFADEKLGVSKPVQFSWDEKGRLYVACSPTYPHTLPGQLPTDYILVLEDTDGDGKADKSHRFAEGLTMVQGIEPGDGGLYVCDFDQILHLRDTDGDGKADERKIILSGFGIGDTHQLVNSISRGPDGCLWFTQGLHAYSRVETPHGITRLDKAGVWKFNPRTLKLTAYFNGGAAGHNCWGVVFDDWFRPFHKSGDRPHGYFSLPGLIDIPDPDDYHSVANLFESSPKTTALDIIGTKALPEDLQGTALIGGYFGSVVETHRLIEDASGFTSKQLPRLLTSSDNSFRPVDVGIGPDGGIYLADWLNPVIGHYQASYADPRRDRVHGRIWRISSKSLPPVKQPNLSSMSIPELLEQLRSPERWTRYQVRRLLGEKPAAEVLPAAAKFIKVTREDPQADHLLLEAASLYQAHDQYDGGILRQLLDSQNPLVTAYGARLLGHWPSQQKDAVPSLIRLCSHGDPRIRLEAIVACAAAANDAQLVKGPLEALEHPRDRHIDYAVKQAVKKLRPRWEPSLANGNLDLLDGQIAYLRQFTGDRKESTHPGKQIYESLCLNCHQPDGKGLPGVYPPLTPNEWVGAEDVSVLIRVLLHGLTGPISVNGKEFRTTTPIPMPPMGLDDQQTADILTYIRGQFGNQAPAVTKEQVMEVRAKHAGRTTFWTQEELK